MATKKISELPLVNRVSGSQVAGGSVLPIVIGGGIQGTTNQISVENFSLFVNAYNATTSSNTFIGTQNVTGDVNISGRLTVKEVVAQYETASILFSTGSTKLGDELTDKHEFTGSTNITGSLIANGFITLNGQSLNNSFDRLHQASGSLELFTSSQAARNLVLSTVTGSINQATASLQFHSASVNAQLLAIQQTTQSLHVATASLNAFTASQDSRNFTIALYTASLESQLSRVYQTTQSLQVATASLQFHSASVDAQLLAIQQTTQSLQVATASINSFTSSQLVVNLGNSIYTASVDSHIVGISTYTSSVRDTLSRVYQTTESIQFQTASLLAFTASQDSRNFTLSQVTGSLIGITNGLMAFTAALDNTYATDAQLYQLYQATRSIELHSGSMVGVTNGLMAYTASNTTLNAGLRGEVDGIEAYTASLKGQAIVSSSTQITNYYKFAETASANTIFYGGINVTNYSKFGKTGVAKALDVFGGISVTGSVITQQNSIGGFVGSYYAQWDSFGSQGGDGNASVGYFVGTFNDDRKLRLLSDSDILLTTGINKKIQVAKASIGTSKVEITGSFNVTGSSTTVGNFEVLSGSIIGSILATNGVVSSSQQVQNYDVFALNSNLYTSTGSLVGITNRLMAFTASITQGPYYIPYNDSNAQLTNYDGLTFDGRTLGILGGYQGTPIVKVGADGIFTSWNSGSFYNPSEGISGDAVIAVGNVTKIRLKPGSSGNISLNANNGNIELTGSAYVKNGIYGQINATNNVVSSSQQITNYNLFAQTSSANTFYGNQNITGSLRVTGSLKVGDWFHGEGVVNTAKLDIRTSVDRGLKVDGGQSSDVIITTYQGAVGGNIRTMRLEGSNINIFTGDGNASTGSYIGGFNTNGLAFASGKGIDFSATSNGSGTTTSELLNDYEEGTWTPTLGGGTADPTGVTYDLQTGNYTKVGRLVTINFIMGFTTYTGGTGAVFVRGLPFACAGGNAANGACQLEQFSFTGGRTYATLRVNSGDSVIDPQQMGASTTWTAFTHGTNITSSGTGKYITGTITYTT